MLKHCEDVKPREKDFGYYVWLTGKVCEGETTNRMDRTKSRVHKQVVYLHDVKTGNKNCTKTKNKWRIKYLQYVLSVRLSHDMGSSREAGSQLTLQLPHTITLVTTSS